LQCIGQYNEATGIKIHFNAIASILHLIEILTVFSPHHDHDEGK